MSSPFELAQSLLDKSKLDYPMSDYNSWMINKIFSNSIDTIFFAEIMNKYYHLDKDIQNSFYLYGLPKGKKTGKWNKAAINNDVDLISKYYRCNRKLAEVYLSLLSEESFNKLKEKINKGGRT
jgi:hypothetical protein